MTAPLPLRVYAPAQPKTKRCYLPRDIAATIRKVAPDKRLVMTCVSEVQAFRYAKALEACGLRTEVLVNSLEAENKAALSRLIDRGQVDVICTNWRLLENLPTVDGFVLLRKIPQSTVWLKTVMVAKRPRPGKNEALLIDFAGNVLYHGVPE